jgi:hypothetical protein
MVSRVSESLKEQREYHFHNGIHIDDSLKNTLQCSVSPELLGRVRRSIWKARHLSHPLFYQEACKLGLINLAREFAHTKNFRLRALFQGPVHAAQFEVLGLERYVERLVRGSLTTSPHVLVPLEAPS